MANHAIFNERPECQERLIQFLINMGYEYVSRSEAESKRGNLTKVVFEDENMALRCFSEVKKLYPQTFLCRPIDHGVKII